MTDCDNARMRDRLPDLLHGRLGADDTAAVRQHVARCAACRDELALLGQVAALTPKVAIDTARISAAIPRYTAKRSPSWMGVTARIVAGAAATIVAVVALRLIGSDAPPSDAPLVVAETASAPAAPAVVIQDVPRAADTPRPAASTSEIAIGDALFDLTDEDLRDLLEELPRLEARTPQETEVVLPAFTRGVE